MVELNFGCPHPAMMPGAHGGSMIGQEPDVAYEGPGKFVTRRNDMDTIIADNPKGVAEAAE